MVKFVSRNYGRVFETFNSATTHDAAAAAVESLKRVLAALHFDAS